MANLWCQNVANLWCHEQELRELDNRLFPMQFQKNLPLLKQYYRNGLTTGTLRQ